MNSILKFAVTLMISAVFYINANAAAPAPSNHTAAAPSAATPAAPVVGGAKPYVRIRGRITNTTGQGIGGVNLYWASAPAAAPFLTGLADAAQAAIEAANNARCAFEPAELQRSPAAVTAPDGTYEIIIHATAMGEDCYTLVNQAQIQNFRALRAEKTGYSFSTN